MSSGQFVVQDGQKKFQFSNDGSTSDVVVPVQLTDGQKVSLVADQIAILNDILAELEAQTAATIGDSESIKAANDYSQTISYFDPGTVDERIETITHSSATLNKSVVETFAYAGSAGSYRLTSIVRSVGS